jgi:hypothetical protein
VQSVMHAGTFASFYKMGERNLLSGLKHVSYFPSSLIIPALRLRFVPTPPPDGTMMVYTRRLGLCFRVRMHV